MNDSNAFQKFVHRHHLTERMSGHLIEQHMLVFGRSYDTVFLCYNDAESYYAALGFRGLLRV
jgi:hypothetical protein